MFACLYSLSVPVPTLVRIAEDFTPRFEVVGPLVMLDVSGLSRLFGSPREIGEQIRRSCGDQANVPIRIAMAPTQTAAALLALGRAGLTVVLPGEESQTLAMLPVTLLGDFDRLRLVPASARHAESSELRRGKPAVGGGGAGALELRPPHVAEMEDVLPYFHSCLDRASDAAMAAHCGGGGWIHPRDSHAANLTRRSRRPATAPHDTEHPHAGTIDTVSEPQSLRRGEGRVGVTNRRGASVALADVQALLDTLRRWGIKTFGALAALPVGEVYERLGARGVLWQRLAQGENSSPLVPWVPEDPFESMLELEWPIEGLEPLSFVLGRLLEPLAERLERADRGAAVLHTHLRLVSKDVHARTVQLPAPMRDPKTLRTLILLDLESNPPSAAIDRVRVLVEPTPARVTQWMLFERAVSSPEQVSTLLARLTALMGDTRVGSPRLLDSWKPGVFAMDPFVAKEVAHGHRDAHTHTDASTPASALRRFRMPVPARVQVHEGQPVRIMTDRRGITGGAVVQAAGPWRTSGEWWNDPPPLALIDGRASARQAAPSSAQAGSSDWDRDEWDVAIADGTVYRVFVERDVGQWFIEGVVD